MNDAQYFTYIRVFLLNRSTGSTEISRHRDCFLTVNVVETGFVAFHMKL